MEKSCSKPLGLVLFVQVILKSLHLFDYYEIERFISNVFIFRGKTKIESRENGYET